MKLLIVCSGGVSTSIMAESVRAFLNADDEAKAMRYSQLDKYIDEFDVVLIAPQIETAKEEIEKLCQQHAVACGMISYEDFGCMDGESVAKQALDILQNCKIKKKEKKAMNKIKITLACAGGVSTSILCNKLVEEARANGYELECKAYGANSLTNEIVDGSLVILMGPQVCYMEDEVVEKFPNTPVRVMSMMDYGTMNAKNIFGDLKKEFNL